MSIFSRFIEFLEGLIEGSQFTEEEKESFEAATEGESAEGRAWEDEVVREGGGDS